MAGTKDMIVPKSHVVFPLEICSSAISMLLMMLSESAYSFPTKAVPGLEVSCLTCSTSCGSCVPTRSNVLRACWVLDNGGCCCTAIDGKKPALGDDVEVEHPAIRQNGNGSDFPN